MRDVRRHGKVIDTVNALPVGGEAAYHGVFQHDVLAHALCDALLGAAGLGDIGTHFPDTDPKWKGANSLRFLEHVVDCIRNDRPPLVDGREGRRSLELITAIYESIESGR